MPFGDRFDAVLAGAREGAEWAWTELYNDLAPVVLGYLRGQGGDHPEDIASEVFLQVVRDLGSFSGDEASFRSWVFTIAHHRLVDARRKARRQPAEATPVEDLAPHLPVDESEPDALANVTIEELEGLFDCLTDEQRTVLLLRIVGGLTISEVAEVVDKRAGAVKALQRRALNRLRGVLVERTYPLGGAVTLTEVS